MKHFRNYVSPFLFAMGSLFIYSCDNNDEIMVDPNAQYDAVLEVNEAGPANPNVTLTLNATETEIDAKVSFKATFYIFHRVNFLVRSVLPICRNG